MPSRPIVPTRALLALAAALAAAAGCAEGPTGPALGARAAVGINAGYRHTCALAAGGAAYCWGDGWAGQLGDGFSEASPTPVRVAGRTTFASLGGGGGGWYTCAVAQGGTIYCWGSVPSLVMGRVSGSSADTPMPEAVPSSLAFSKLAVGPGAVCALDRSGKAYCWGDGALGSDSASQSAVPIPVSGGHPFTAISLSYSHACGIAEGGKAFCWGDNWYGQLGEDTGVVGTSSATPVPVAGDLAFRAISTGGTHTCGIAADGAAWCWGTGNYGELGVDTAVGSVTRPMPVPVSGGLSFIAVSTSGSHTCGIATGGAAYCWGRNDSGQLGTGDTTPSATPVPVHGGLVFSSIAAGVSHTCAVTPTGYAYCWGDNTFGKLGDGTSAPRLEPTRVSALP